MKHYNSFLILLVLLVSWSACRKDLDFSPSTGHLTFSKDTVYLDTIFENIGSTTYTLKVYNNSADNIVIPEVKLTRGEQSDYRLSVDGITGKVFDNVEILAKDSLYIFIETTVDLTDLSSTETAFLYTDAIAFGGQGNTQKVPLVTLVKDAFFIYPDRDPITKMVETLNLNFDKTLSQDGLQGRELLPEELTFKKEKPYVIYGFAVVPEGETLTIEAGSRIYFHENSGLIVPDGASLQVQGDYSENKEMLENEVVFQGDRLSHNLQNIPGQWGAIWLATGSQNNQINHATIKNATIGLLVDGDPDANKKLTIQNTQIYNSGNFGVLARNTNIHAENLVVSTAGQAAFAATLGGRYSVTHSTIANYWTRGIRQLPALLMTDFEDDETAVLHAANFNNSIIYGNGNSEILLQTKAADQNDFNFKFTNCLIRFEQNNLTDTAGVYDFSNTSHYENVIFNKSPDFKNPQKNNFIIGEESAGIAQGASVFSEQVPRDILNEQRRSSVDLGAYQHSVFSEED